MASKKGGVKNIGPASSTPAVSPAQPGSSKEFFGGRRATEIASPIDRTEQNSRLLHTIDAEGHEVAAAAPDSVFPENKQKKPTAPFPFPRPEYMDDALTANRYECVVDTLDFLKHYVTLHERFGPKPTDPAEPSAFSKPSKKGPLPPKGPKQPQKKDFKFTPEMFMSNNTEAFIQVTHLLFEALDESQAKVRFRDCWPIYEKKQESAYRRVALEWFKEIVTANPKWFSRSVKVEQLQGLVVNPYGDRFIRFMQTFSDFVVYHVTKAGPPVATPLMDKPVFTGKNEVTYRQAQILGARIDELTYFCIDEEERRLREVLMNKDVEKRMKAKEEAKDRKLEENTKGVAKFIKRRPDLFPENAEELLNNERQFFKDAFRDIAYADRWRAMEVIFSPLYEHVHKKLLEKNQSVVEKVDLCLEFFKRNSRFFALVKAAYEEPVELDLATLWIPEHLKNKPIDLDELLDAYATIIEERLKKLDEIEIPEDLVQRKELLDLKVQALREKLKYAKSIPCDDQKKLKQEVDFEIRKLEIELEDVDWSVLSGVNDPPLATMFDFSPTRTVDAAKQTGLTPAISSYLPALDFSRTADQSLQAIQDTTKKGATSPSGSSVSGAYAMPSTSAGSAPKPEVPGKSIVPHQSVCDSPVSHLPPTQSKPSNRFQEITSGGVQLRDRRRDNNTTANQSKFRLSLPVVHDEDHGASSSNAGMPDATEAAAQDANNSQDSSPEEFVALSEASEQRINALLQSLADATEPDSPEPPTVKARNRRRSSQNFRRQSDYRRSLDLSAQNLSTDLESKLGIMDVSMSMADFLDLSNEDDEL